MFFEPETQNINEIRPAFATLLIDPGSLDDPGCPHHSEIAGVSGFEPVFAVRHALCSQF